MARVAVPGNRAVVADTPEGLRITIPAKRNVFVILFLAFWLVGWIFGEVFALRELSARDPARDLFMVAWLSAWTLGGAFALYAWLWAVVGKEQVSLAPSALVLKRDILGFGRTREFDVEHISHLRVSAVPVNFMDPSTALQFWGVGGGPIAFDYGSKTIRFGSGLSEAEARQLVERIQQRHSFK